MLKTFLDLLADRESGASEIERRLCAAWLAAEPADAQRTLSRVTEVILERHPAMANLLGWADQMWRLCEAGAVGRNDRLRAWIAQRLEAIDTAPVEIGRQLVASLHRRPIVFTLSRSGTLLGALAAARLAGARPRVRIAESRPESEGLALAADLMEQGIETAVLPDFSLASLLGGFRPRRLDLATEPQRSLLLVGADGVTVDSFVNKVGTAALARVARAAGVPVLVAVGSDKLLPPRLAPAATIGAEPWETGRRGVPGRRFDFERIANRLVDRFVLPDGELVPEALAERIGAQKISRHLARRLSAATDDS